MKLFECIHLKAGYVGIPVLSIEYLNINNGDFIGIIGPNGAGKSTFIKVLARVLKPLSGTVLFKNSTLANISLKRYAMHVATVLDIEYTLPYSVYHFITMGRYPHTTFTRLKSHDYEAIEEAIHYCEIQHILQKKLTELSSGELQRVNIARALAQSTECILLDEPISHLDIYHAYTIMDILKQLNKKGKTIITILHDINIASEYCTKILALKEGSLFFYGTPEECITYYNIESLFNCICVVYKNPISNKPYVYPVPQHVKDFSQ